MPNSIRFATGTPDAPTTRILDWETLATEIHPDLVNARVMLAYEKETKAGEALYQGDILSLRAADIAENDPFWRSNAGEKMKERGFDAFVLHLTKSAQQPLNGILYAIKDSKPVTDSMFYGYENELDTRETDDIWKETDATILFIHYALTKGATLLGNDWEHADILAPFIRKENP